MENTFKYFLGKVVIIRGKIEVIHADFYFFDTDDTVPMAIGNTDCTAKKDSISTD
jgi:hypothetical protein